MRLLRTTAATVVVASAVTIAAHGSTGAPAAAPVAEPTAGTPATSPVAGPAAPISGDDRVYTADQTSNTVTVVDPATNAVLGTLPLGQPRLDGILGPVDDDQVNVHGLGASPDGRYLAVVSVTSNAVQIVDTATNAVLVTKYVGRAPHEAAFSPDGRELWIAVRGQDYVSVVDLRRDTETRRIPTAAGPSDVAFSPDGRRAYVNHLGTGELVVIDVRAKRVSARVALAAGGSADLAVSPDGQEVWLGHPGSGKTTVVDARTRTVKAVLDTGPRTNHPAFVAAADGAYAWVSVGGLDHVKVYRRGAGSPALIDTIPTTGRAPHGIWPSPDSTRVYVALQKSDAMDVIDTATRTVVATAGVGQDPQALVYVARSAPGTAAGLSDQGLGERIETYPLRTTVAGAAGDATVRNVLGLDEVDVAARGLAANTAYDVHGLAGGRASKLLTATSDGTGGIAEALAFTEFFDNGYDAVALTPAGAQP